MAADVAFIGMSTKDPCGVHDHARLLADAMRAEGIGVDLHWLLRAEDSIGGARAEVRAWTRELGTRLAQGRPAAVIMHYSVFAYSHRGLPLFVAPTLATLRRTAASVIVVLHEFAYPWARDGWRGTTWAIAQRATLIEVMRTASAAVVTMDSRARWLQTRAWLPRRQVVVTPVFSNLPAPAATVAAPADGQTVGLFGYASDDTAVSLVLDAFASVRVGRPATRLSLLGAPGAESAAGKRWMEQARIRGVEDALSFSGVLSPHGLSDALAGCDLLLFAERAGPSSRKTTLAASLAAGKPLVAIDGPSCWAELAQAGAARVVEPSTQALAHAMLEFLSDRALSATLATRGGTFASERMTARRAAASLAALVSAVSAR